MDSSLSTTSDPPTERPAKKNGLALGPADRLERLRAVPTFAGLADSSLEPLARRARPRFFHKGTEILREGEPGHGFYLVVNGRAKMVRSLPNGRCLVLGLFGPGDLFGVVSTLGDRTCDASIVALDSISCLVIERDRLFQLFEEHPKLVGEILPVLTGRLVECKNCIVEMSCYRVEKRFAHLLLKFADSVGQTLPEGIFIPIPLSRQELADMTGTTIETCIRIMSRWSKGGVVETKKDGFLVKDRAALGELIGDVTHGS